MRILLLVALLLLSNCQKAYYLKKGSLPKYVTDISTLNFLDKKGSVITFKDICDKHDATVFIFWQTSCPCVKRYQERVNYLFNTYKDKNVGFYHVSSNSNDALENVLKEYNNRSIPLPLLRDNNARFAHAIEARGTPAAALIDKQGQLVFLGWIDNERYPKETGRIPYLENALKNVLNHEAVKEPTSPMFGCAIY